MAEEYKPIERFENTGDVTTVEWHRFDLIPNATVADTAHRREGIKAFTAAFKLLGFKVDADWFDDNFSVILKIRDKPSWHPAPDVSEDWHNASLFHCRAGLVKEALAVLGWGGGR